MSYKFFGMVYADVYYVFNGRNTHYLLKNMSEVCCSVWILFLFLTFKCESVRIFFVVTTGDN